MHKTQYVKTHISCSNHVCCYTSPHTSTHMHTHTNHTCTHKRSYTNTRIYTHTCTQTLLCGNVIAIQYLVSGQLWQWPASQRYQRSWSSLAPQQHSLPEPPSPLTPSADPPAAHTSKMTPSADPPAAHTSKMTPSADSPAAHTSKMTPSADSPAAHTSKMTPSADSPAAHTSKMTPSADPPAAGIWTTTHPLAFASVMTAVYVCTCMQRSCTVKKEWLFTTAVYTVLWHAGLHMS